MTSNDTQSCQVSDTNARSGFLVSLGQCVSHRYAISSHISLSVSAWTWAIAIVIRARKWCRVVERGQDVDSVFHISPQAEVQRYKVWQPWWPCYWSLSSNPNRWWIFPICSKLSLHNSARSWLIKPQTTLFAFHTTVRPCDCWLVVRVHFL